MNIITKAVNIGTSLSLFSFIGALYATGVFSSAIDSEGSDAIKGRWASSMGSLTLISTLSTIAAAIFLERGEQHAASKTLKVRLLTALSAFFFFSGFGIAAKGVRSNSSILIILGISLLGTPLGVFYLLCTELISVWMPKNVGFAVGMGQAAFGLGPIIFSGTFSSLIQLYGTAEAIWFSGLLLGIPTATATFILRWPKFHGPGAQQEHAEGEYTTMESGSMAFGKLSIPMLSRSIYFWLYIVIVFCSQTGFVMVPFFFDMGTSFGSGLDDVIVLFQVTNIAGTLSRLLAGVVSDYLSIRTRNNGAKLLMCAFLGLQASVFLGLGFATNYGGTYWFFSLASAILFVTFSGGACVSAILARELFGSQNSATVYGLGGGTATGVAESGTSFLVAHLIAGSANSQYKFRNTFMFLALSSSVGFICAIFVKKSKDALSNNVTASQITSSVEAVDVCLIGPSRR